MLSAFVSSRECNGRVPIRPAIGALRASLWLALLGLVSVLLSACCCFLPSLPCIDGRRDRQGVSRARRMRPRPLRSFASTATPLCDGSWDADHAASERPLAARPLMQHHEGDGLRSCPDATRQALTAVARLLWRGRRPRCHLRKASDAETHPRPASLLIASELLMREQPRRSCVRDRRECR